MNKLKNELVDIQKQMELQRRNLDLHNHNSVNDYNQTNDKLVIQTKNYILKANNYNQSVKLYKTEIETLKRNCSNKRYKQKSGND